MLEIESYEVDVTLVSAIVPTYNRSYVIEEAIKSILSQTYQNIEIVIVDDGSTDDTLTRLSAFEEKIRLISQPHEGPAAARNRGIRESRGHVLTFLDSDDVWLPNYIERQMHLLESSGPSVPCSLANGWLHFADGEKCTTFDYAELTPEYEEGLWLNPHEILATRFVQFNQMVAIRRAALDRVGWFDSSLKYLEDWDLALRLSVERPWAFTRKPLVLWRQQKDSLSLQARSDEVTLRRTALTVRKHAIESIGADNRSEFRNYMLRELERNQRELRAATLSTRGLWGRFGGGTLRRLEKMRKFVQLTSQPDPNMKVATVW